MSSLTFRYEFSPDGDHFGVLDAVVETQHFRGANNFWVQWQDVLEFASALSAYPLPRSDPPHCEWGMLPDDDEYSVVTSVTIAPDNLTGDLLVTVNLADQYDIRNRCQTAFRTNYPDVEQFRAELEEVMKGTRMEAVLKGQ